RRLSPNSSLGWADSIAELSGDSTRSFAGALVSAPNRRAEHFFLLRVAQVHLEIGGAGAHAVDRNVVRHVRGERAREPAGLVEHLAIAIEERHAVIDVQLAIGSGADRDGDVKDVAGFIARGLGCADGGVVA